MNRFIIPLAAFAVLLAFLAAGLKLDPRALPSPLIGRASPAFASKQLPPAAAFDSAQMAGRVWLLNVWASWCAACLDEHPLMNQLARAGLPIVGLNYKDDGDDATAWLARFGNPYAHTPVDRDGRIGLEFGVYGVPETYLIDAGGVIRFKRIGPLTVEVVRRELLPLLAKLGGESS